MIFCVTAACTYVHFCSIFYLAITDLDETFVFKNYIQRTNFKTLRYCMSSISHRIDQYRLYITQDPLKFNSPNLQI